MENGIHIALSAERITEVFGVPITNTLLTSWAVIILLGLIAFIVGKSVRIIPGKVQSFFEYLFEFVISYMEQTLENRALAVRFFPFIMTIFLFIFFANILEFTPGIGSVGLYHQNAGYSGFTPLFRSVNTDLNVTLALAIISFFVIQTTGVLIIGFLKYTGKFVNFKSILGFFIGIIELFSEVARLISFSFRLFGNIFAGEVLILVVMFFMPLIAPVPLMLFEVFVGFIQAAIFALLTLFFIKIAITETSATH